MPSRGMSRSSSWVGNGGAPSSWTEAGPPERTSALGARSRIFSTEVVEGKSSAKTPHSRTRRAISCEYWPPKSRTSTSSTARTSSAGSCCSTGATVCSVIRNGDSGGDRGAAVGTHADRLLVLELLALAHQRRSDHHLGPLEGADVLVATGGHRGFQRPDQVEGAVVLLGRAEEDLLQGSVLLGGDTSAARQGGMEGRHPPVEAAARGLLRPRQR